MPEMPVTYYGRRQRHAYWAGAVLLATAVCLRVAPVGAPGSTGLLHLVFSLAQGLIVAGLVLAGPAATRVTVWRDGVEIRNLLRTHRVGWAEVRGFSLDEERFPYVARLETASGELSVHAISDEPWISWGAERMRNQAMIEALNGHWRAALTGDRLGPDSAPAAPAAVPAGS